jgi:propionyl-CoA synthetase
MIPAAVIALPACARIGDGHSMVFSSFAACERTVRIEDAKPNVIVSASFGFMVLEAGVTREPNRII